MEGLQELLRNGRQAFECRRHVRVRARVADRSGNHGNLPSQLTGDGQSNKLLGNHCRWSLDPDQPFFRGARRGQAPRHLGTIPAAEACIVYFDFYPHVNQFVSNPQRRRIPRSSRANTR